MSARLIRTHTCWLLITLAVSFLVAACAAGEGPTTAPPPPVREGTEPPEQSTREAREATPSEAREPERMGRERTPMGDVAEVRRPWVQVRSAPNADANAIALAFGNDRLTVVDKQGDWVRVRLGRREGWIPASAIQDP